MGGRYSNAHAYIGPMTPVGIVFVVLFALVLAGFGLWLQRGQGWNRIVLGYLGASALILAAAVWTVIFDL